MPTISKHERQQIIESCWGIRGNCNYIKERVPFDDCANHDELKRVLTDMVRTASWIHAMLTGEQLEPVWEDSVLEARSEK